MMHRHKVKLLLWFAALLSVLALVVAPALANGITLTVVLAGAGTGTVTSAPAGINCPGDCELTWTDRRSGKLMDSGVQVTLTAIPDEGSVFTAWDEQGCLCLPDHHVLHTCEMSIGADRTCTANFGLPVGGIVVPVNKLGLLAPWLGVAALASLATLTVALVRRRRSG